MLHRTTVLYPCHISPKAPQTNNTCADAKSKNAWQRWGYGDISSQNRYVGYLSMEYNIMTLSMLMTPTGHRGGTATVVFRQIHCHLRQQLPQQRWCHGGVASNESNTPISRRNERVSLLHPVSPKFLNTITCADAPNPGILSSPQWCWYIL